MGARYYVSWLARWIAVDPLEAKYTPQSPYVYCSNNPIGRIDETGMGDDDYTVKKGDTLTKIAQEHHTTVQNLVQLNHIKDPDKIQIGQKLSLSSVPQGIELKPYHVQTDVPPDIKGNYAPGYISQWFGQAKAAIESWLNKPSESNAALIKGYQMNMGLNPVDGIPPTNAQAIGWAMASTVNNYAYQYMSITPEPEYYASEPQQFKLPTNKTYEPYHSPAETLPRNQHGVNQPSSTYPHTQLAYVKSSKVGLFYVQTREWGFENGILVNKNDIHWTDHGRPQNHVNPHAHPSSANPVGGSRTFGKGVPVIFPIAPQAENYINQFFAYPFLLPVTIPPSNEKQKN